MTFSSSSSSSFQLFSPSSCLSLLFICVWHKENIFHTNFLSSLMVEKAAVAAAAVERRSREREKAPNPFFSHFLSLSRSQSLSRRQYDYEKIAGAIKMGVESD
jgi:hypothetical protein